MSDKFEFIESEYATAVLNHARHLIPTITVMCALLEVSRSGYYAWRERPASATWQRREQLKTYITASFENSNHTYGYRRVHADLVDWGVEAGPELVRALMTELGLRPCQPRPWRHQLTEADPDSARIPDLIKRDFTASAPGVKMVGDITYIPTWQGWLFLATVIDCHTKEVIGWAMADHYRTALITEAIEMAARNHRLAPRAIFHSDRGSNYTSKEFAAVLETHGLRQSVGHRGSCFDNAMAESFFAVLKNELVHRTQYPTREHARKDIAQYIELWYNRRRRHSGINYRTPAQIREQYLNTQQAA